MKGNVHLGTVNMSRLLSAGYTEYPEFDGFDLGLYHCVGRGTISYKRLRGNVAVRSGGTVAPDPCKEGAGIYPNIEHGRG